MKTTLQIILCLNFAVQGFGQAKKEGSATWTGNNWIQKNIDKESGDTIIFYPKTEEYLRINKQGIKVIEGRLQTGIGQRCGDEAQKNGVWIERYKSGELLSVGTYDCGFKFGEWIYFYKNGNKQKIENYSKYYFDSVSRMTFINGNYFEFYENGNLEVQGSYNIKLATDSLDITSPEPPYIVRTVVTIYPHSFKSGVWYYYELNGTLKKREEH